MSKYHQPTGLPIVTSVDRMYLRIINVVVPSNENGCKRERFDLRLSLVAIEKQIIEFALSKFQNQTKTAEFLGMKEQVLRYKMKKYRVPSLSRRGRKYATKEDSAG